MSNSILSVVLGVVALAAASPAAAEPFRAFLDMCLTADANAQSARDAAQAAGWTKMPAAVFSEDDAPFEEMEVYFAESPASGDKDAGFQLLMTGWQSGKESLGVDGVRLDMCAVGFASTGDDGMAEAMERYVGFAATEVDGKPTWMFSRQGDHLRSESGILTDELDARLDAVRSRKLLMAGVWTEGDMTLLVLGASRPGT